MVYKNKIYTVYVIYEIINISQLKNIINENLSWRSVLLVKKNGVPGENQRPAASH